MTTVAGMIRKLESLVIFQEVQKILQDHKAEFAEMNRQQWKEGKRSTGNPIGKYRNGQYAMIKNEINSLPGLGNVDLILTRGTVESITTDITGQSIVFKIGDDSHGVIRYGENILGLAPENKERVKINIILPELLQSIRQKTGMK